MSIIEEKILLVFSKSETAAATFTEYGLSERERHIKR